MAVRHEEVPLDFEGMSPDSLDKGAYLQNMERFAGHWKVRKGFGQVGQFDSTLSADIIDVTHHLGSYLIETDFGHEQLLTVLRARVYTGGLHDLSFSTVANINRQVGGFITTLLVSIYDLTTDELYEVPLHRYTSQQGGRNDWRRGVYETDVTRSFDAPVEVEADPFWFAELNDTLLFGSRSAGVWLYRPATFSGQPRSHQLESYTRVHGHAQAYAEEALVIPVVPADGLFDEAFAYLQTGEFPSPQAGAVVNNRAVYAAGRTLFFSDPGRPGSVAADNFTLVPCQGEITALAEVGGNLVVFTAHETYHYAPPISGFLVSGGRLIRSSSSVGCDVPSAVILAEGSLFFAGRQGIYVTDGNGLQPKPLSEGFDTFFQDHLTNPWTNFFQQSGATSLANTQPRLGVRYDPTGLSLQFDARRGILFVSFPSQDVAFVLQQGKWTLWYFESVAAPANTVRALRNVTSPWLIPAPSGELYAVGGIETVAVTDDSLLGGITSAPTGETQTAGSYYLLQYGRGGGLERTVGPLATREDRRTIAGKWYTNTHPASLTHYYRIAPPLPVPNAFVWPNSPSSVADAFLLPVELYIAPVAGGTAAPDGLTLIFRFDSTHWTPIFRTALGTELDFMLPPERAEAAAGFGEGAPVAGTREVQCYDSTTGVASRTGNEIRVRFQGGAAGYIGPNAPFLNLNTGFHNPVLYLPFFYNGPAADDCIQQGIDFEPGAMAMDARIVRTAVYNTQVSLVAWQEGRRLALLHNDDDVAQPVDYIIKPNQVDGDGAQLKARTLYLKASSRGNATTQVQPTAVHGQLNVLYGSDHKGWAAQVVDHAGNLEVNENIQPLRSRFRNNSGAMVPLTFDRADTAWGNVAVAATGNVLIADDPVDTLAISESVKGERLEVMIFGHIRSIAEALSIESAKLSVVAVGQRRRVGR